MRLLNRVALASTPVLLLGTHALAACSAAAKLTGCVDMIDVDPKKTSIGAIITNATGWILNIVGAIAILFIIWAGIQYVTSAGNKDRAESAKKTLTYAVIGLIIIILARVIVGIVTNTAGALF